MSWLQQYKVVRKYLVRIETQQGSGTGFLFGYNGAKTIAAIATASHVIEEASDWKQPIRLIHYDSGEEVFLTDSDRAILLDRKHDSATILIKGNALKFPEETLPLLAADKYKSVGAEVAWMGFPSVAYPDLCFFTGHVSAFFGSNDYYLIDGVAINGVSGGPVFSLYKVDDKETAQIIGTVSAYISNRVRGDTLPGLLRAQDISPFHATLQGFKDLDEARQKEEEEKEKQKISGEISTPITEPEPVVPATEPEPQPPKEPKPARLRKPPKKKTNKSAKKDRK